MLFNKQLFPFLFYFLVAVSVECYYSYNFAYLSYHKSFWYCLNFSAA